MAISKTLIVTLNQDKAKPREKFFIYRNDVGVDIYIELSNLTYQFDNEGNKFKQANALFKTPTDKVVAVNSLDIENNKVVFSFTSEIIKNMQVIGKYELQIQLFDSILNRITLPIINFEVKEPLGQTGVDIQEAMVDYAIVGSDVVAREVDTIALFSMEDGYVKTVWETGDLITASRLNNMEDGIYNNRVDINLLKNDFREISKIMNEEIEKLKDRVLYLETYLDSGGEEPTTNNVIPIYEDNTILVTEDGEIIIY